VNCLRCGYQTQKLTCTQCGYTVKEGESVVSLFKLDIGGINREIEKLAKLQACSACGEVLQPKWKFCPFCGAPAVDPSANRQPAPSGMVFIQGGTFMMGSLYSEVGRMNKETQHSVTVNSFYIGQYEVTQREWREVMGNNPSHFSGDNLPVEHVSWYEAVNYCNKRSQREGLTPAYTGSGDRVTWNRDANGYRLPTEAEWEYACRAGTATPYYTGSTVDDAGWYDGNSGGTTHPVGQKPANAWGLYDMHGNVYEWCWDWYGEYPSEAQTDPTGAETGSVCVNRGGSWNVNAQNLRSASRHYCIRGVRYSGLGFRLARSTF
jgi:formylglycine-generating enzyme required for sulfatase activity